MTFHEPKPHVSAIGRGGAGRTNPTDVHVKEAPKSRDEKVKRGNVVRRETRRQRRQKLVHLQVERDRFEIKREIQDETRRFKQYSALPLSVLALGVAVVFQRVGVSADGGEDSEDVVFSVAVLLFGATTYYRVSLHTFNGYNRLRRIPFTSSIACGRKTDLLQVQNPT